jgi:hypothetical protein
MNGATEILTILLPVATTVGGALWGLWLYIDHKNEVRESEREQHQREARSRLIEGQKPFLELQLRLYFEAAEVTGNLVTETVDSPEWNMALKRFWALYWSKLSMVENAEVEGEMEKFGDAIEVLVKKGGNDKTGLQNASYDLAHAIRRAIEEAWGSTETNRVIIDGGKRLAVKTHESSSC